MTGQIADGFRIETKDDLEGVVLEGDGGRARLVLAPSRGGLATRLRLGGDELFYLDEGTLRDTAKNVRGGNPVLFPSPGQLAGDAFLDAASGKRGELKQHGFARNLPWDVTATRVGAHASVTVTLASTAATRASYPWDFLADYTYTLDAERLRIDMVFENRSPGPMPFGAGFHPYFHVPQAAKARAAIGTGATRAFDNVTKADVPVTRIDLTGKEVDLHLHDHGAVPCTLTLPDRTITLRGSPEFSQWVVWTLEGKDFVCVEPWTCPGNALNTGERLLLLAPGEKRTLWVEIART